VAEIASTYSRRDIADRECVRDRCFISDRIDRGDGKTLGADELVSSALPFATVPEQEVTPEPASEQE